MECIRTSGLYLISAIGNNYSMTRKAILLSKVVIFCLYIFVLFFKGRRCHSRPYIEFAGAKFTFYQNGDSPNKYIWIHGDEQTAKLALTHHFEKYGGIAFFIDSETREIPESTIIDPNRIFQRWRLSCIEKV